MSKYTPSTAHIRKRFVYSTGWDDKKVPGYSGVAYLREKYAKEFNDWLAEHDRQIAEAAWKEGFDYADYNHGNKDLELGQRSKYIERDRHNPYQRKDQK